MQFLKNTNINFLGKRKIAFVLSTILFVVSIVFLFVKSPNWGIDFTGGSLVHLKFESPIEAKQLRSMLEKSGITESDIQQFRNSTIMILRIKKAYGQEDIADKISQAIKTGAPGTNFEVLRNEIYPFQK